MSDTEYKITLAAPDFLSADADALSYPAELLRSPVETMARSVDSTLGGYRLALSRHTGGAHEFLVDSTATGGGTQGKPDAVTWRRVMRTRFEQQAGTALIVRILHVPSGASEFFNAPTWDLSGVGGQTRVAFRWDKGFSSETATVERTLDGENDPDGAEKLDAGAQWAQLGHQVALIVRPGDAANDFSVAQTWAEWITTTLDVEDRGGARVVHVSVGEIPVDHVAKHDDTAVTYTGSLPQWETNRPQIEAADGATFEEHRYGSHRQMDVTARQTERVGPIIAQWSAYDERAAGVADTDVAPKTTTSASFTRISRGQNTVWDEDEVGWFVLGTARAPEHLSTRISGAGSVPVLVRAEVRFAAAGAAIGVLRFATTDRSFVDMSVDQAVVGTTWTVLKKRASLEASVATDDFWPKLQEFFKSDGVEQLEVRWFSVSYGDYSVGA